MPILNAEPTAYPEDLLLGETTGRSRFGETDREWFVVQTKPRQEKSLARDLHRTEIPFFLPLTAQMNRIRGKDVQSYIPIFHGYVFLLGDPDERVRALKTNRITSVLQVYDQELLERELSHFAQLIAAGEPLSVEGSLAPGKRVRVKQGALQGLEGVIIQRRGKNRLLVGVTYLQQGVSMEINDHLVEPCD